jgi:hypothetical protein
MAKTNSLAGVSARCPTKHTNCRAQEADIRPFESQVHDHSQTKKDPLDITDVADPHISGPSFIVYAILSFNLSVSTTSYRIDTPFHGSIQLSQCSPPNQPLYLSSQVRAI